MTFKEFFKRYFYLKGIEPRLCVNFLGKLRVIDGLPKSQLKKLTWQKEQRYDETR